MYMLYVSWVKPVLAQRIRAKHPFEPGADRDVSRRERLVRGAWRYDDWYDRIMSLIIAIAFVFVWWFALTGTIPFK